MMILSTSAKGTLLAAAARGAPALPPAPAGGRARPGGAGRRRAKPKQGDGDLKYQSMGKMENF